MQEEELASIPLFSSLSKRERATVGRYIDRVDVPAGKKLAEEGSFAYEFFVIEHGEARVSRADETLRVLAAGDFFGEVALLETDRRTASVTATTDMRLLVMHARDFRGMLSAAPAAAERVRDVLRERVGR